MAFVFLGLWVAAIEARLVYLQVFRNADLVTRATHQQSRTMAAAAKRGDILDRKGRVLATSVDADSVIAVPSAIDDPAGVAKAICGALGDCKPAERDSLAGKLGKTRAFAYVKRQVSPEQAKRVAALNLDGIGFMKEDRRFYPNKELAAHLLGYVGLDNTGLSGLESTYDTQISGKPGTLLVQTDARRHAFSRFERPPTTGSTIELTIDEYLQHVAERELDAGIAENRARGGTAIIMDPHTGEILAMANAPTFNPNVYREFDEAARRNRAVQDLYEPGSTFKVVTASAAIEEKVMPITTLIDTNPGQIRIDRTRVVRDVTNHGVLSFEDVIVESSNVGAIKIGFKVGTERLSQYVQRFGFGRSGVAGFSRRERGHRVAGRQVDRERARVRVDGISDRRHAAADGRGHQFGGQRRRVRRAPRRPRDLSGQPAVRDQAERGAPHDYRGHGGRPHVDHGGRRRTRNGEAGAHSRVHDRGENGNGGQARRPRLLEERLQRVVCRVHPVAQPGCHDSRRPRLAARPPRLLRRQRVGADLQAHRRGDAPLPRGGADDQSRAARARGRQRTRSTSRVRRKRRLKSPSSGTGLRERCRTCRASARATRCAGWSSWA